MSGLTVNSTDIKYVIIRCMVLVVALLLGWHGITSGQWRIPPKAVLGFAFLYGALLTLTTILHPFPQWDFLFNQWILILAFLEAV